MIKSLWCWGIAILLISQPVKAHRRHSSAATNLSHTSNDINNVDQMDENNHASSNDTTTFDDHEKNKKSSQDETDLSQETTSTPLSSPTAPQFQMPIAIKGIGVPGSPNQQEVRQAPVAKKDASQTVNNSNNGHGHLIKVPRSPSH